MEAKELNDSYFAHATSIENDRHFDYVEPQIGKMTRELYAAAFDEGEYGRLWRKRTRIFQTCI